MDLTLAYPVFNRTRLFAPTLTSILSQVGWKDIDFEVLVVDDGSTDDLLKLVRTVSTHGLKMRYVRIDAGKYVPPPSVETIYRLESGAKNPALALNVCIQQALGDRVVLSSPEILYRQATNLKTIAEWPLHPGQALIGNVWDQQLRWWISGGKGRRPLHFLACYWRKDLLDIGGFEERFMGGCGYEDTEFCDRWVRSGRGYDFTGSQVLGDHQFHPRPEIDPDPTSPARVAYEKNANLYRELVLTEGRTIANEGWNWGGDSVIVDRWPT